MGGKELTPGKNKVRMEFRGIDIAQHVLVTAIATLEFPSRNCRSQAWKNIEIVILKRWSYHTRCTVLSSTHSHICAGHGPLKGVLDVSCLWDICVHPETRI